MVLNIAFFCFSFAYTFLYIFYSIRLISIPNSCMSQCLIYVYF